MDNRIQTQFTELHLRKLLSYLIVNGNFHLKENFRSSGDSVTQICDIISIIR